MKWVEGASSSRTMFEQFLLKNFGQYADLSSSDQLAIAAVLAMAIPALLIVWSRTTSR